MTTIVGIQTTLLGFQIFSLAMGWQPLCYFTGGILVGLGVARWLLLAVP